LKEFVKDHYVVAIDMRGFNLSFKPSDRQDYSMKFLMEDLEVQLSFDFLHKGRYQIFWEEGLHSGSA
jgi:hypothetical protein